MERELNNGKKIPAIGFGVYQMKDHALCKQSVLCALKCGYRLIDTAAAYENEAAVGEAIKECGISRDKIFISSKLWATESGYEKTKEAFERSMKRLGLEYVDMYLPHLPWGDIEGSWKAIEEFYNQGRIKAIGVSNCTPRYLSQILSFVKVKPVVDQIECHPLFQQKEMQTLLKKENILLEAWGPLAQADPELLSNTVLEQIAAAHGKTVAQVTLRWHVQEGFIPIPKSSNPERIESNFKIWDFELTEQEMTSIRGVDKNLRKFLDPESAQLQQMIMHGPGKT